MIVLFDKEKKTRKFFNRNNKKTKTPKEEKAKYVQAFEKDLERAKVF